MDRSESCISSGSRSFCDVVTMEGWALWPVVLFPSFRSPDNKKNNALEDIPQCLEVKGALTTNLPALLLICKPHCLLNHLFNFLGQKRYYTVSIKLDFYWYLSKCPLANPTVILNYLFRTSQSQIILLTAQSSSAVGNKSMYFYKTHLLLILIAIFLAEHFVGRNHLFWVWRTFGYPARSSRCSWLFVMLAAGDSVVDSVLRSLHED